MTVYCQSVLSEGKFKFYCPSDYNCNREWEYFIVRHVACFSPDELKEFEKRISTNYLEKTKGFQLCPGCGTWCYNEDGNRNHVECPLCKKNFCWACSGDWIGSSNGQSCGGCEIRTRVLANCPIKVIAGCQACPTKRACPNCGMLTEHKGTCARLTCVCCGHHFCFICLRGKSSAGAWSCALTGTCTLAPRQISTYSQAPAR